MSFLQGYGLGFTYMSRNGLKPTPAWVVAHGNMKPKGSSQDEECPSDLGQLVRASSWHFGWFLLRPGALIGPSLFQVIQLIERLQGGWSGLCLFLVPWSILVNPASFRDFLTPFSCLLSELNEFPYRMESLPPARTVVLNLWILSLWGVKQPFRRGSISDILHIITDIHITVHKYRKITVIK